MLTRQEMLTRSQRILDRAGSNEDVLRFLKANGASRIDSISVVAKAFAVDLAEAKRTVHLSATWAAERQSADRFHDELASFALAWADERP